MKFEPCPRCGLEQAHDDRDGCIELLKSIVGDFVVTTGNLRIAVVELCLEKSVPPDHSIAHFSNQAGDVLRELPLGFGKHSKRQDA